MIHSKGISMARAIILFVSLLLFAPGLSVLAGVHARVQAPTLTPQEKAIFDQIRHLRDLSDDVRASKSKQLALEIRQLKESPHKLDLAFALAGLSTEGDFGHDTLQEVATTLAEALRDDPAPMMGNEPAPPAVVLGELIRYEQVKVSLDSPQLAAAIAKLIKDDESRQNADFTLTDLQGKSWSLKALRGKVVLVNFWATWCQPCRREMPDLDALYKRFKDQGFVILGISDEDSAKVKELLAELKVSYPVLLDPGRKVNELFRIEGIPKNFVFDRNGKLVAQSIDMRTQKQFLAMLAQAGLH